MTRKGGEKSCQRVTVSAVQCKGEGRGEEEKEGGDGEKKRWKTPRCRLWGGGNLLKKE